MTFLVRKPETFKDDAGVQVHIAAGRATVIVGDATAAADLQKAIDVATPDYILFSVGGGTSHRCHLLGMALT